MSDMKRDTVSRNGLRSTPSSSLIAARDKAVRVAEKFAMLAFESGHWPNPTDHHCLGCRICFTAKEARRFIEDVDG